MRIQDTMKTMKANVTMAARATTTFRLSPGFIQVFRERFVLAGRFAREATGRGILVKSSQSRTINAMTNLITTLAERGFLQDLTPGAEARLAAGPVTGYVGF